MNENQSKVRVVDTAALLEEYRTLVQQVDMVPLVVSGSSMTPFLVHGRDTVYLSKVGRPLRRGDIVLYRRKSGAYILHRICRVRDGAFDIVGDAQTVIERGIEEKQIFAVVRAAKRTGRRQLPGVDAGAPDLQAALDMVELAARSGVTAITVTPHAGMPGYFENYWGPELRRSIEDFIAALRWAGARVSLYTGMEIFGTPDTPALLRQGKLMTLNGSRYPLIEFPFGDYADEATDVLRRVAAMGYRPVVAHPERYRYTQADPTLLSEWLRLGCLLQINRGSLIGRFGRASEVLIKEKDCENEGKMAGARPDGGVLRGVCRISDRVPAARRPRRARDLLPGGGA